MREESTYMMIFKLPKESQFIVSVIKVKILVHMKCGIAESERGISCPFILFFVVRMGDNHP